ncbi:MAG: ABC transporter permease [Lachnospiraceae bacterium]|nr:ABC transporter permease [Lachnospiraceae bacterium]
MMEKFIKDFKQNMFAIHQLTERDKKHENAQTFLGELWEIFNPLIMTVVMVMVFSTIFASDSMKNYGLFVLTGMTLFNLFSQGTTGCLGAIVGNKNLLIKTQLKRSIYVFQKVALVFRNFLYSLIIYAFMLTIYKVKPEKEWLLLLIDVFLLLLLIFGLGKILAIANVYFADISYFYKVFTVFLIYGSAIFYQVERFSTLLRNIIIINPIYDAIYIARQIVLEGNSIDNKYWLVLTLYGFGFYFIGSIIFNRLSDDIVAKL